MTLIKEMRLRQQMNLLKERVDKTITLKETQIVEEESTISFDSENSIFFLHLDFFI